MTLSRKKGRIMENINALNYAKMGCDTLMKKYKLSELPPSDKFHYHQGVFLSGMERTYLLCKEEKYNDYIKSWVDRFIDENGNIGGCDVTQFDDLQPSILLFRLYTETGDERYKKALDSIVKHVEQWPKNAQGGFWHKFEHPNQMWLDGLYMIGPYHAMYAYHFGKQYFLEVVYRQMKLMTENMRDSKTGLLYHAWDDSKLEPWADGTTGLSPEFWGRAVGWYAVAIMDILQYYRDNDERKREFETAAKNIINAVIKYQDEGTGLWCQVVDKPHKEGNWFEISCSCLFTYAIAKAIKTGLIGSEYIPYMQKAYNGVIGVVQTDIAKGEIYLDKVCVGTCVGDYDYYIHRNTVTNDLHGMGAFVLMCTEVYETISKMK